MKKQPLYLFELPKVFYNEPEYDFPYIIYIATEKGNCNGILYEGKTLEGVRQLCSHPKSCGQYMGVEWAYFYTKKSNIEKQSMETYGNFIKGVKKYEIQSDDRFSEDYLQSLGIRKVIIYDYDSLPKKIKR